MPQRQAKAAPHTMRHAQKPGSGADARTSLILKRFWSNENRLRSQLLSPSLHLTNALFAVNGD
ncbi:Protein of unknown function [Gryllus bimaculatus]|nr:Protein of unknown function [Gryllus bimaculatus]